MKYLNKDAVVSGIVERTGLYKTQATKALNAIQDTVTDALAKKEGVRLIGFGSFKVNHCKSRNGHNPATNKPIKIAAHDVPKFTPGSTLKRKVNK